jgi:hypothetical protein
VRHPIEQAVISVKCCRWANLPGRRPPFGSFAARPILKATHVAATVCLAAVSAFGRPEIQPQVEIQVRLVEVSRNNVKDIGFDTQLAESLAKLPTQSAVVHSSVGSGLEFGAKPSAETVGSKLFPTGPLGALNLSGVVSSPQLQTILDNLNRSAVGQIISAPLIYVPNEQAAGVQLPSITPGGVRLEVQPQVSPEGNVILNLAPKVEDFPETTAKATAGSGETLLLGGTVPTRDKEQHCLIVFVTPRVVNVLTDSDVGGGDKINVEARGTGNTIGHVADLQIRNLTNQPLTFLIPAFILESKSGRHQDYACPHPQDVAFGPNETKTVPLDGVCVDRDKPPVGKNVSDELVFNTGDPAAAKHHDCHRTGKEARDLLRYTEAKYSCVEDLEKKGGLKDFPYSDKQKQKDILVQWSTWSDPRICQITKSTPATKADLQQVVYKQADKKPSRETKKKLDQGIDKIFEEVELTNEKAKELEKPDPFSNVELTGAKAKDQAAKGSPPTTSPAGASPSEQP